MRKLGLALSGGGARGFAHIGVLKVLTREGIPIQFLAGTSFGGIIAAAFAAGITPAEMEEKSCDFSSIRELIKLLDPTPTRRGFLEGNNVHRYLESWLGKEMRFEDLQIPLTLNAVDLITGNEIVMRTGNVLEAVFATIAFPGLFSPVKVGGGLAVDGGVLNNLPINHVKTMGAEVVIGVEVQVDPSAQPPWTELPHRPHFIFPLPDYFLDFYRAQLIMVSTLTQHQLAISPPDLLIQPEMPPDITMFLSFPRAHEIIQFGTEATEKALSSIRQLLED
jgi:NTE family protein